MALICANCSAATKTSETCSSCGFPTAIDGKYVLEEVIGQGASGITYRAHRISDGQVLCIKELSYSHMLSFEQQRLFEREAQVLQQLKHAQIPKYYDFCFNEVGKRISMYLVQEFVDGQNLKQELQSHRYTDVEVCDVLIEILDILIYLSAVNPPLVHRDIKPSNIMRRHGDNSLVLVDFGSVKELMGKQGSTITGTFGYMAPEQLWGDASPQSDIYAVAMLGVVLLSRLEPEQMVNDEQELCWQKSVSAAAPLVDWLQHALQKAPGARPGNPGEAKRSLQSIRAVLGSTLQSVPQNKKPVAAAPMPTQMPMPAPATRISAQTESTQKGQTAYIVYKNKPHRSRTQASTSLTVSANDDFYAPDQLAKIKQAGRKELIAKLCGGGLFLVSVAAGIAVASQSFALGLSVLVLGPYCAYQLHEKMTGAKNWWQ